MVKPQTKKPIKAKKKVKSKVSKKEDEQYHTVVTAPLKETQENIYEPTTVVIAHRDYSKEKVKDFIVISKYDYLKMSNDKMYFYLLGLLLGVAFGISYVSGKKGDVVKHYHFFE